MRYRVTDYTIEGQTIVLPISEVTIEDIRLVVNETQQKVICSSMQKSNVYVNQTSEQSIIAVPSSICEMQPSDKLTIEIDKGDSIEELAKQGENQGATNTAIYNAVNTLLSRSVKYDKETGNLTIENVELIIE